MMHITGCILQGAVNCLLSFPFKGKGADGRIGVIFTLRAVLPRLIAAEGALSFLLIEKKQKIKACSFSCKNLRKSRSWQHRGSYPCLSPCSRFDPALGCGLMKGSAKISVLFPTKICHAG
jgi:hypothetical protein